MGAEEGAEGVAEGCAEAFCRTSGWHPTRGIICLSATFMLALCRTRIGIQVTPARGAGVKGGREVGLGWRSEHSFLLSHIVPLCFRNKH